MSLRFSLGLSVVALVIFGGAMTDLSPASPLLPETPAEPTSTAAADAVVRIAAATQTAAEIAAATEIVAPAAPARLIANPAAVEPGTPAQTLAAAGTAAIPAPPPRKPKVAAQRTSRTRLAANSNEPSRADPRGQAAGSQEARSQAARSGEREPKIAAVAQQPAPRVRSVGPREMGDAAWYGGRYVGRRTSSGQVLDRIHPTAAHRTLPLNSLARVTNLDNGRSVVVKVTDRGPVSDSLVIDVSPVAAEQLDMKAAGVVPVMVEQVVALPPDAH
ncbi:MAG TPA: septal ring lytic transglycosylase RlpA family protein [Stellaceae bacterium]|nr:septal ring lytic transglycosylase RlpA family protein [Stellaceae bacterium]